MTNEIKVFTGTPKTLEANGASCSNNNVVQADDATYAVVADGAGYPDAEFGLSFAFATAPTENTTLDLYCSPQDIDGTNDSEPPENGTAFKGGHRIGTFICNNVTTTQYAMCRGYDLPMVGKYWLHNNGTGQTLSSGWVLKVTPRTFGPA